MRKIEMKIDQRLSNCHNRHQGSYKRVLCVCSAGLLRSPTVALVLSKEPFNYNTRAVGLEGKFALIKIDKVLLAWADEIVCMEGSQKAILSRRTKKPIICLDLDDDYSYRDPHLMEIVAQKYTEGLKRTKIEERPYKLSAVLEDTPLF